VCALHASKVTGPMVIAGASCRDYNITQSSRKEQSGSECMRSVEARAQHTIFACVSVNRI
jgi:hypothetical protein